MSNNSHPSISPSLSISHPQHYSSPSAMSDERIVRRRRGPFKRSRTGCGTCKRRGKKCDEDWSAEGFCQRCLAGPWECTGRTTGRIHTVDSGGSVSNESRHSGSRHEPSTAYVPIGSHTHEHIRAQIDGSAGGSGPSTGPGTVQSTGSDRLDREREREQTGISPGMLSNRSGSGTSPLTTVPQPIPNNLVPESNPNVPVWNGYLNPGDARPWSASTPLFDWPNPLATPSAVLTTCPDGTLAIDTPQAAQVVDTSLADFWNDLSASFSASGNNPTFNPSSRVIFLNSDKPMRQGVSLAEIYARVVESWLVGLPGPTRDYARARILALNDSNSVMRAVRYAVAAAYIFLFASDPHADPQAPADSKPKPKLVELACRGAGLVEGTGARAEPAANGEKGGASRKLRFYVDHVSTPFAADLESTKWTEDAVQELRSVVVTERGQLSDLLWGVIDLQLVEFIRGGAAPSYNMLALGDRLVRSALGRNHPAITLSDLRRPETFSLRLYALSDVSRCIVQRGRRTIFQFNTDDRAALPLTKEDETWSTYLGLPDSIVILLAEIVNLCADQQSGIASSAEVKDRAEGLEAQLRAWTPTPNAAVDASALVSRMIAGELWRLCCLILLYQSVHRVGGLHPVLRRAHGEILTLLGSVTQLPNGDLWGFIALPAFLAAALSIDEADRKKAMTYMIKPGPERVWLDNIALVEKVWEEIDNSGRMVEWHECMMRHGMSVAFF